MLILGGYNDRYPWIHMALSTLSLRLHNVEIFEQTNLQYSRTISRSMSLATICHFRTGFSKLNEMVLFHHRFPTFRQFLRIIGSIKTLQKLSCYSIKWSSKPYTAETLLPITFTPTIKSLVVDTACTDLWEFMWLLTSFPNPTKNQSSLRLRCNETQAVIDLCRSLFGHILCSCETLAFEWGLGEYNI